MSGHDLIHSMLWVNYVEIFVGFVIAGAGWTLGSLIVMKLDGLRRDRRPPA